MDAKTEELLNECEATWSWYCRSLTMEMHEETESGKAYWMEQRRRDCRQHTAARAAFAEHLARLELAATGATLPWPPSQRECRHCGYAIDLDERVCPNCGH